MANMSYCRFINTLRDLQDCYANIDEEDLSEEESRNRKKLIRLCGNIVSDYGDEEL